MKIILFLLSFDKTTNNGTKKRVSTYPTYTQIMYTNIISKLNLTKLREYVYNSLLVCTTALVSLLLKLWFQSLYFICRVGKCGVIRRFKCMNFKNAI